MANSFKTSAMVVWPVRPNIDPFKTTLRINEESYEVELSFPPLYAITPTDKLPGHSWCQLRLNWNQEFQGTSDDYKKWLLTKTGKLATINRVVKASHSLVDQLKTTIPQNRDIASIRHFGYRDWPLFGFTFEAESTALLVGPSAEGIYRTVKTPIPIHLLSATAAIPFAARTLCRAADLSESGYPTEAVLLAFAVLDSTVQRYLTDKMKSHGMLVESSIALLRNVTQRRLSTYLGPVLKLVDGRSLQEDDNQLFKLMLTANKNRNDAIHNGIELKTEEAIEIIATVYDVLLYLKNGKSVDYLAALVKPFQLMDTI